MVLNCNEKLQKFLLKNGWQILKTKPEKDHSLSKINRCHHDPFLA
jgi:hypothetical protein